MHEIPVDVQNAGPSASSCKKKKRLPWQKQNNEGPKWIKPLQPDHPPPPALLKRADLSPAPIRRREHLRLKSVKVQRLTKKPKGKKPIGMI